MSARTFAIVVIVALLMAIAAIGMHGKGRGWIGELGVAIHGGRH